MSVRQKSSNLECGQLLAERELTRAVYGAVSSGDPGFFAQNSATVPWRVGNSLVGNTDFSYAIYAQTVSDAATGNDLGQGELNNHLKKVDIVVYWWDGQVRARAGQGQLRTTASLLVNELRP